MVRVANCSLFLYFLCLMCACNNLQNAPTRLIDKYIPEYTIKINVDLPQFLPCPDGWIETNFDTRQNYVMHYCEPPQFDPDSSTMTPQAPNPPNFLPCPQGWIDVEDATTGVGMCAPYSDEGPMECHDIDEAHFPGESGCVPIGTECPQGDWDENLPTNRRRVYVKKGAVSGPNTEGTMLDPFGSINEAIEFAGEDAIIALSKGTFNEIVELPRGIGLWGACVSETVVTSTLPSEIGAMITSRSPNTEVRNLQITGQRLGVIVEGPSAQLHIQDVLIKDTYALGIVVHYGRLSANSLVVTDTQSRLSDDTYGGGLMIEKGASVAVSRAVFTHNRHVGIYALGSGTKLTLGEVRVSNTLSQQSDGIFGIGLMLQGDVSAVVSRSVFSQNRYTGIYALGTGAKLTLEDVLVNDTLAQQSDGTNGIGLMLYLGASAKVSRSVFSHNRYVGISALGSGTELTLDDVLVRDTFSQQSDRTLGIGLNMQAGSSVVVSHSVFTQNRTMGISAVNNGTELTLDNVLVSNTLSQQRDKMLGGGLRVDWGAEAEVSQSRFTKNRFIGVGAYGEGTKLRLEDVIVSDTLSQQKDGMFGRGLEVGRGAVVDLSQGLLMKNRDVGVGAFDEGTKLTLVNVIVSDTLSRELDGHSGRGLTVDWGAEVEVSQGLFAKNREFGVMAAAEGTKLRLEDVVVRETLSREVFGTYGQGLVAAYGAEVEVSQGLFTKNRHVGVMAYGEGAKLTINDMIVSHTLAQQCASDYGEEPQEGASCFEGGIGVGSYGKAKIEINRFGILKNNHCGAQIAPGRFFLGQVDESAGEMKLLDGIVSHNDLCGINIQTENINWDDLKDSMLYFENNHNNLDTADLPTPEAPERIESSYK